MNKYIGHKLQYYGVEEYRLQGGKADGMRMLSVRNGCGLELVISLDRCADIVRLICNGINYGFMSPCGYVSPEYYNKKEFLRSFTAGFMTTCGLSSVGGECEYNGEVLPMHGTVANIPAEWFMYETLDDEIIIKTTMRDAVLFGRKFILTRTYKISLKENKVSLFDDIENIGGKEEALMLLYHCNMGYPLLDENAKLSIPNNKVVPRDVAAEKGLSSATIVEVPQDNFDEQCFYYDVLENDGYCKVGLENKKNNAKISIVWKKDTLGCFTQWKMMGTGEYVMGLEPGNCTPDGIIAMEKHGILKKIKPNEHYKTELNFICG